MHSNKIVKTNKQKFIIIDSRCREIAESTCKYRALLSDTMRNVSSISLSGIRLLPDKDPNTPDITSNNVITEPCQTGLPDQAYEEDYQITMVPPGLITAAFNENGQQGAQKVNDDAEGNEDGGEDNAGTSNCNNCGDDEDAVQIKHEWDTKIKFTTSGDWKFYQENTGYQSLFKEKPSEAIKKTPYLLELYITNNEGDIKKVDVIIHKSGCPCTKETYHGLKDRTESDYCVLKIQEIGGSIESNCNELSNAFTIMPRFKKTADGNYTQDYSTFGNMLSSHTFDPLETLSRLTIEWVDFQNRPIHVPEHVLVFALNCEKTSLAIK